MKLSKTGSKISNNDISRFENDLNIILPEEYKNFLLANNGGMPDLDTFETKDEEWGAEVEEFYGLEKIFINSDLLPNDLFVIGETKGGNYLCISTAKKYKGKIFLTKFEDFPPSKLDYNDENLFLVANNFNKFMLKLHKYPYYEYNDKKDDKNKRIRTKTEQLVITESADPITADELEKVEKSSAFTLPDEYKKFILKYNGGKPKTRHFTCSGWGSGSISEFKSISKNGKLYLDDYYEAVPRGFLCIGDEDGGNYVYLCVIGKNRGKVYYKHHEIGKDEYEPSLRDVFLISDNFDKFLDKLDYFPDSSEFEILCLKDDLNKIEELIDNGTLDLKKMDENGYNYPLYLRDAIYLNNSKVVTLLVKKGVEVSFDILRYSLYSFNEIKALIENSNFDINFQEPNYGNSLLLLASSNFQLELVKYLIKKVKNINAKNNDGKSALDLAKEGLQKLPNPHQKEKFIEIIKILEKAGAK